ncbi:hypothetical protein D3C75_1175070 [compost metagenome]
MSNWIQDIQAHVKEYTTERDNFSKELDAVLEELSESGTGLSAFAKLTGLTPLEWEVSVSVPGIGRVTFEVSYDEILILSEEKDKFGDFISKLPNDLNDATKKLITKKMKETLYYKS